jgi:hypothetical protein
MFQHAQHRILVGRIVVQWGVQVQVCESSLPEYCMTQGDINIHEGEVAIYLSLHGELGVAVMQLM